MKIFLLNKCIFYNLFAFISILEFLLFGGIVLYDFYTCGTGYISIYSSLRIIFKIHFILIPACYLLSFVEYFLKKESSNLITIKKISVSVKLFYILAFISFIFMTLICIIIGYPPTEEELHYD